MTLRLVIHAGAGTGAGDRDDPLRVMLLEKLLLYGRSLLRGGARALDVVQQVMVIMEDASIFNAGRGAVTTVDHLVQLDASLMDGACRRVGAVSVVSRIKNPILMARVVMTRTPHNKLVGPWAETLAEASGLEMVDPKTYYVRPPSPHTNPDPTHATSGTVGAVCLDLHGDLASSSSTGGISPKLPGRPSDVCDVGASLYADNDTCAISCTGIGEYFARAVVSYDIVAQISYQKTPLGDAVRRSLAKAHHLRGLPVGGVIAVDPQGTFVLHHDTDVMLSGYITETGDPVVKARWTAP